MIKNGGPLFHSKLERIMVDEDGSGSYLYFHSADVYIQNGPQCGFAALLTANRAIGLKEDRKIDELIYWAKEMKLTNNGEMFSC